jgi:hypothetical protein
VASTLYGVATHRVATKIWNSHKFSCGGSTRSQSHSEHLRFLAIDGKIGRNSDRQGHRLLPDGVVVWKLLDGFRNIIDSRLMALAPYDTVLVWRIIGEPLEELSFFPQRIGIDTKSQFLLRIASTLM